MKVSREGAPLPEHAEAKVKETKDEGLARRADEKAGKNPKPGSRDGAASWGTSKAGRAEPTEAEARAGQLEAHVADVLLGVASEPTPEALVAHLSQFPFSSLGSPRQPPSQRLSGLWVSFLQGHAMQFLALTTPQTPEARQKLSEGLKDVLLYLGRSLPPGTQSPPAHVEASARVAVLRQFEALLHRQPLDHLRDEQGRTVLQAAQQVYGATTREELLEQMPQRFEVELASAASTQATERGDPAPTGLSPRRDIATPSLAEEKGKHLGKDLDEAPAARPSPRRKGVLGGNMLWNVLHALRGSENGDEIAERDATNRIIVSALLILGLGAILVGVLVLL
jgi:hypothetical protein